MREIAVLVACGKAKRDGKQPAYALYESTLFEKSWMAASYNGDPYVMSAKHHLLHGDKRIETYNKTLRNFTADEKREWGKTVVEQLPAHYETVVLLGGRDYVEPIINAIDDETTVYDPYQHTSGNGQQMTVADRLTRAGYNGNDIEHAIEYAVDPYK